MWCNNFVVSTNSFLLHTPSFLQFRTQIRHWKAYERNKSIAWTSKQRDTMRHVYFPMLAIFQTSKSSTSSSFPYMFHHFPWVFPPFFSWLHCSHRGVVHLTGGIAGLAGTIVLGPRKGRFEYPEDFEAHNLPLVVSLGWVDGDGMANSTKISDFRWDGIILWWFYGDHGDWKEYGRFHGINTIINHEVLGVFIKF